MKTDPRPTSAEHLRAQARAAWRLGRVLTALPALLIALAWVGLAWWFMTSSRGGLLLPALNLLVLTTLLVGIRHASRRLVLPALLLGSIPLGCALLAQALGHQCGHGVCSCASWCAPLCGAGGLTAGLLLARAARYEPKPWQAWALGGGLIVSAGALGCGCLGASGLVGMLLGFLPSAALLVGARSAHA